MRMQHKKKSFIFGNIPLIEDLSFEQQTEYEIEFVKNYKEINALELRLCLWIRNENEIKYEVCLWEVILEREVNC